MSDGDIDYSRYSLDELQEAFAGINEHQYPKKYANLRAAYGLKMQARPRSATGPAAIDAFETQPRANNAASGRHVVRRVTKANSDIFIHIPNVIPAEERRMNIIFSVLLFAYGSYGVWVNDLYIPGKHSRGVHLHDVPAWIMYGAMICACVVMLSVVVDHYDCRPNERHYRTFAEVGRFVGWGLFGLSMIWAIFK
jgi:hypothetical protein